LVAILNIYNVSFGVFIMQFLASALQKSMEPFSGPTESLRSEIAASSDQGFKKTQDAKNLGFSNTWYRPAMDHAEEREPEKGLKIRLVALVYFCSAKLDAYARRGIKGYLLLTPAAGRSGLRHSSSLKDS
jgi:hypothetical protein